MPTTTTMMFDDLVNNFADEPQFSPSYSPRHDPFDWSHASEDGAFADPSIVLRGAYPTPRDSNHLQVTEHESQTLLDNSSDRLSVPLTETTTIPPKIGGRFTRDVIRALKNWLASHESHPYPTDEEVNLLKDQTGLSKTQITNWFANARRRSNSHRQTAQPSSRQSQTGCTTPINITPRPGTPALRQDPRLMNPLERWVDSPPENEPAMACDIARAVISGSEVPLHDPSSQDFDDAYENSWRSPYYMSPASSAGTSQSSDISDVHSSGSQSSLKHLRLRRRRRVHKNQRTTGMRPVATASMPYQCTFCTEVFKTKHDWQRHEKSLHLPLEQWICSFQGPAALNPETNEFCCAFCGAVEPDDAHFETHCYSACQQRSLNERTFHRKDHLSQHLKIFHNVKFINWSMNQWRATAPDVRSRCGFCSAKLNTWPERVDHLAEHFKLGKTMVEWRGEWGFDDAILELIEGAIPPYLIDQDRNTMLPSAASNLPMSSPANAYEFLKLEIEHFMQKCFDKTRRLPTNDDMQLEACRIILASETSLEDFSDISEIANRSSWLRDLIMSSTELTRRAKFGPLRLCSEGRLSSFKIKGKASFFEHCPLEFQLRKFIEAQRMSGIAIRNEKIQEAAREIVRRMERDLTKPSSIFTNWINTLIYAGTGWIVDLKMRAGIIHPLDVNEEIDLEPHLIHDWSQIEMPVPLQPNGLLHATNPAIMDHSPIIDLEHGLASSHITNDYFLPEQTRIFFPGDLDFFLGDLKCWLSAVMSPSNPNCHVPSDDEIQHHARWIIYNDDDPWNQTPADNAQWLSRFKRDAGILDEHDTDRHGAGQ